MSKVKCPSCSVAFEVKSEWSGRRVRCPKCKQPFQVPVSDAVDDEDGAAAPSSMNWLVLGAAVVIALAIGGAAGFVVGHKQGKSDDVRELNEAKSGAAEALQQRKALESELAALTGERDREKARLEAVVKERDMQLAAAQEATAQAIAQARASKEKLDTLLAKNQRDAEADINRPKIPAAVDGIRTVTAKEIETFGGDMIGQRRQLVCRFEEVSDTWVRLLLRDDSYVGLMVTDDKGTYFQYSFAKKDKFGKELVDLKSGTGMRLVGTIASVDGKYVLLVDEIRR